MTQSPTQSSTQSTAMPEQPKVVAPNATPSYQTEEQKKAAANKVPQPDAEIKA